MMGLLLTLLAFAGAWYAGRRSAGHGFGVVLLAGYFYGLLRARYPDGFSHFIFDGGLAGLYLAMLTRKRRKVRPGRDGQTLRTWVKVLMVWPLCTLVISPFLDSQHLFIQLVGLRVAILMLPLIAIGGGLDEQELDRLGEWVLWLNGIAFAFALLELRFGVEPFFPRNASSQIIYISMDVGADRLPRIPSVFNSAHAYAGTMLLSLPLLVRRWGRKPRSRWLTASVMVATVLGIFASAARSPVLQLALVLVLLLLLTRFSLKMLAGVVVVGLIVGAVVMNTPRFQRFLTLQDTDAIATRVGWSMNMSLTNVLLEYPLGNGLGSGAGTSVPFFLIDLAKPQIGLENEFGRIALEQGLIGLVLWLCFLAWMATKMPPRRRGGSLVAERMMWLLVMVLWCTAFIGTGLLASVPGTALLLLWKGVVIGTRRPSPAPVSKAPSSPRPPQGAQGGRPPAPIRPPEVSTG
jgi:hypothetical protein